ncbi:helicase-related protein [Thermosyntropha sp.]|uniref:helicase-related protein n=1 Tax=Thermosyntropha sp. TaxID=2740820 RepID=UPI0025E21408|nr:helicase-related protein [Thermosyntropha sp.]MBO8159623.1 hypothetical protein [Thermosyntropha sp.]
MVAGSRKKIEKLEKIMQSYRDKTHMLVYCGAASLYRYDFYEHDYEEEERQIEAVINLLGNKLNMKVAKFTAQESIEERMVLEEKFAEGRDLQALVAIRCLDEGVNIPAIRTAFILSSTTNPKEYIQRRGRVLRLAEGKDFAGIYDFITLPRDLSQVPFLGEEERKQDTSLVKKELERAEEFGRLAINRVVTDMLIEEIMDIYKILIWNC